MYLLLRPLFCYYLYFVVVIQSFSGVQLFVTPWTAAHQTSLSFTISWSSLKPMSIESMMPSNHLTLCCPLLHLSSIFPSIRVFSNESSLLDQVAKISELQLYHQSFQWISSVQFSCSVLSIPMNIQHWFPLELTDLISLLSKGISSLFQHHSSKASILWHWAFFMVQLSYPYVNTLWICVSKVISLLFNTLSSFVMDFLPRSKYLLISWLQSLSAVILEPKKIKSLTISIVSHLFFIKWWDQMPWTPFFERRVLSQLFHSPLSPSSRGSLLPLCFLPLEWYHDSLVYLD